MSCVSFAVGLGNVWRFPYKAYKNGGGAFLIPYLVCVVLCGIPIFFLEIALGQFMQQGVIGIWDIYPVMRGLGYASTVIAFLCNCYYIMVLVWGVFYFVRTALSGNEQELPWESCNNTWSTSSCQPHPELLNSAECKPLLTNVSIASESPVKQFWKYRVLQLTELPEDTPNDIQGELFCILAILWFMCYLCVYKGTKSSGKAVYFTATFPYFVLTSLFIRAVTLPGALDGITYLIKPNFEKLLDPQIWIEAGTQVFFSYAIGLGALSALGSYNSRNSNCYRHALIISAINSGTSLLAGFTVFSFLGVMSCQSGLPIDIVANKGPGLAFITYPLGVTFMPHSGIWAMLFFSMLISLGLGSQIVTVQGFITAMYDILPKKDAWWLRQEFLSAIVCTISFMIGIQFTTRSGIWAFTIFDTYAASGTPLLWMVFFESVTIGWFYGADRFNRDIESMIGFKPHPVFKICWKYICPAVTFMIFISTFVNYQPMEDTEFGFQYGLKHEVMGWGLALSSMLCVPVAAIIYWWRSRKYRNGDDCYGDVVKVHRANNKPQPAQNSYDSVNSSNGGAAVTSKVDLVQNVC